MLQPNLIGNKIATARKKANLSQSELAQKIAISPQAVGKWERGESMPDITKLNNLAKIFGVDLNYFSEDFSTNENIPDKNNRLDNSNAGIKKRFDWNWNMSQAKWVDADFSGLKDLKDEFSSSIIQKCKFTKSDLSGLTFKGNRITDSDFSQSNIRKGKIYSTDISKSTFNETSLIDADIQQSEIKNCNFNKSNLSGAEFINSNFQKNSIKSAILKHTSFKNTSLTDISFTGNIDDCSFENCSFKRVKFVNATILNTFFKHNQKIDKVELMGCKVDKLTFAFLKSNGAKLEHVTIIEE